MTAPAPPETFPWSLPDASTYPDLPVPDVFYGVKASYIGDDGDLVMLGHPGPLRAVAVTRAILRRDIGLPEADQRILRQFRNPIWTEMQYTYARLLDHCDNHSAADSDCVRCDEITRAPWWISYNVRGDEPGAFPIVLFQC